MSQSSMGDGRADAARLELLEFIHLVHVTLPQSDLPARQLLEVRRDLVFLVAESRRRVFRPRVVDVICKAVLAEVSPSPRKDEDRVRPDGGAWDIARDMRSS
jgi:hypothetical protein